MFQELNKRRPFGFYMCSLTVAFERAAYYASKWLVVVFLSATMLKGGLGIDEGDAGIMQSYFVASVYLSPVLLAFVADRLIGAKYLVPVGLLFMSLGYSYIGFVGTESAVWVMIVLVAIGTGLFKANIASITGRLFKTEGEKDSAFSIQYSISNIGAFIGTTAVGILYISLASGGENGYLQCFKLAGLICLLGAVWFVFGWKFLGDVGKRPFKESDNSTSKSEVNRSLYPYEKRRIFSIILISSFSIAFWIFWYLTYLAVYDYAPKYINFNIGTFEIPTS